MAIPGLIGGFLPAGRHQAELEDVRVGFVADAQFSRSLTRGALWNDLQVGLALLEAAVPVYQLWIGGSFVTAKVDPGDLDVTFIVDGREHFARPTADRQVVDSFITVTVDAHGKTGRAHGLALDSFILDWWPWEPKLPLTEQGWGRGKSNTYLKDRGYWDDWWQRPRRKPKGAPIELEDALPIGGYLEVNLRDFAI